MQDQLIEPVEPRWWREGRAVRLTQHPEQTAHLYQGGPRHLFDRLEAFTRADIVASDQPLPCLRLHHHDTDRVGDDVVELARQPRPLQGDRLPRPLISLDLQASRRAFERADLAVATVHGDPEQPGDREQPGGKDHVADTVHVWVAQAVHRSNDERGGQHGVAARCVGRRRVDADQHRDELRRRLAAAERERRPADGAQHECERDERLSPPKHERQRQERHHKERVRDLRPRKHQAVVIAHGRPHLVLAQPEQRNGEQRVRPYGAERTTQQKRSRHHEHAIAAVTRPHPTRVGSLARERSTSGRTQDQSSRRRQRRDADLA